MMDLNSNISYCGKSLQSHQAALLRTFDDGLEGLSLWPSFKDGLGGKTLMGSLRFITLGHGCLWTFQSQDGNRDYSNDKSNDANLMTKAMMPIKSNPLNTTKCGNPMGQT